MSFIYIKEIDTNIMRPWNDLTDFFDSNAISSEEMHAIIRYGCGEKYVVVSAEEWEQGEPIDMCAPVSQV